ncbi:Root phototropism protein 3 [Acorus gramineus]|uniref:Root phototropism protein 3 n=1 Tax=Acorus gramineus TaxID=55184 RepID=A0AAV9BQ67_ACOGR|nr:Root phototropism protein 3 [Acorus gramineus]
MWESESDSAPYGGVGDYKNSENDIGLRTDGVKNDGFERKEHSWYVATDIPSDLLVRVGDYTFHLHKYPLLSRCGRINRMVYDSPDRIDLDNIPGGADAFELAAKFCYGVAVDLTSSNISGLRCAAEYLEMTEDLEEGNLIFKTEAFLSYVVLSSWRDSIVVLKSCESLSPWAENLQIVRRCSESIAWKACANPRSSTLRRTSKTSSPSSTASDPHPPPSDWWFEDVSVLRIDHFVRVVTAIKVKGMRAELIGACIMHYSAKWLPGLTRESPHESSASTSGLHLIVSGGSREETPPNMHIREQRMIIESLISMIPPQKDSVSCGFLLRLLRLANMSKAAPALVTELEKRVGMQFEQASLSDLLIPSYSKCETLYDVDLVQRLLEHFLVQEQTEQPLSVAASPGRDSGVATPRSSNAKMRVARLVDSYLTEVSKDRNLSLTKFQVLAEALPESARTCDDGLYRAVDSYLKAHPTLSEHERKRLCRVMDCQKLSIDACMHAAQNERLPLRIVVQVLFSEQVKISNAIANASSSFKDAPSAAAEFGHHNHHYQPMMVPTKKTLLEGTPQSFQEGWAAAKKDISTLKFELESVKAKYLELQSEMDGMQRQFEKMARPKHSSSSSASAWSSGWKRLGKLAKMGTVYEGREADGTMVEQTRKGPRRWRNSVS